MVIQKLDMETKEKERQKMSNWIEFEEYKHANNDELIVTIEHWYWND